LGGSSRKSGAGQSIRAERFGGGNVAEDRVNSWAVCSHPCRRKGGKELEEFKKEVPRKKTLNARGFGKKKKEFEKEGRNKRRVGYATLNHGCSAKAAVCGIRFGGRQRKNRPAELEFHTQIDPPVGIKVSRGGGKKGGVGRGGLET